MTMTTTTTTTATDTVVVGVFERDAIGAALHNAVIAASSDDSRPILTGASFRRRPIDDTDAGRLEVVATDSYRLCVTSVAPSLKAADVRGPMMVADFDTFIMGDVPAAAKAVKSMPRDAIVRIEHDADNDAVLIYNAREVSPYPVATVPTVYGDFPKWDGLFPNFAEDEPETGNGGPAFNPGFLADAGKLAHPDHGWSAAGRRQAGPLRVNWLDALKPAVLSFGAVATAPVRYLLMPVRVND